MSNSKPKGIQKAVKEFRKIFGLEKVNSICLSGTNVPPVGVGRWKWYRPVNLEDPHTVVLSCEQEEKGSKVMADIIYRGKIIRGINGEPKRQDVGWNIVTKNNPIKAVRECISGVREEVNFFTVPPVSNFDHEH